jgi:hypothetical protein
MNQPRILQTKYTVAGLGQSCFSPATFKFLGRRSGYGQEMPPFEGCRPAPESTVPATTLLRKARFKYILHDPEEMIAAK